MYPGNKAYRFFIATIALLCSVTMASQEVSYSLHGSGGFLIKKDESMAELIQSQASYYGGLSMMWKAKGDSVSIYDEMWGCPVIEGGLIIGDYHDVKLHRSNHEGVKDVAYSSGLGYMITPYAGFRRSLLRTNKFDAGYRFENGIGINTRPYDIDKNVENEMIGSRISVFIGMGIYASYRLSKHVSVGIDASFRHYSNGKLAQPNVGINTLDAGLRMTYTPQPDTMVHEIYAKGFNRGFRKHVYLDISAGWCPQTLLSDWTWEWLQTPENRSSSFNLHSAWAGNAAIMWQYSRKYASGFGFDYTYVPFTDAILASETRYGREQHYELSKHVLGLSLHHEAFYKDFSMHASIGYFLQKRLGTVVDDNQKPYYETIGIRWYMPFTGRQVYLGYNINACAIKANYFQFSMGYCPWK